MKWDDGIVLARAVETIARALRQIGRAKAAAKALHQVTEQIDPAGSVWEQPPELASLHADFADQTAFLLVAVRHAIAARPILEEVGVELPKFDRRQEWSRLRDVDHHWEKDARDTWDAFNLSDMPGRHYEITLDGALIGLSGLELQPLERDLVALHSAAAAASRDYSDRLEESEVIAALAPLLGNPTTPPLAPGSWDSFRERLVRVSPDVLDETITVLVDLHNFYAPMPLSHFVTALTQTLLDTATEVLHEHEVTNAAFDPTSEAGDEHVVDTPDGSVSEL